MSRCRRELPESRWDGLIRSLRAKEAANWNCPPGDTSMLKVGESGRRAGVIE